MIYKSFYISIIIRLLIFGITAAGLSFSIINEYWFLSGLSATLMILAGVNIINYINRINRELTFFFDAVRNEDSTLWFKEDVKNKSLSELHKSMNRLNKRISEIKIQNEYNEKFFRELLQYSATGLFAIDREGNIEVINDAVLKLTGLEHISHISLLKQKNEALYNIFLDIIPGQTRTLKLLVGAELRLLSIKVSILVFGDKKYRIYSVHDIQTEMEDNQIDTWQKLIRILTHEIMNSVAPITSLCSTLRKFFIDNGQTKQAGKITNTDVSNTIHGLSVIEERGKGLMHFVDDYRALTKIPKPVFKKVNIDEWLESNCLLMKSRLEEEKVELKTIKNNKRNEFIGDPKLLSQVLINVINNALDALKDNNERKITLKTYDNPIGNQIIHIIDNGKGIAAENLEKIFIPFYTTKENGSGIGLSLSRQIMRMHKGSITVKSLPGKQTAFTLKF